MHQRENEAYYPAEQRGEQSNGLYVTDGYCAKVASHSACLQATGLDLSNPPVTLVPHFGVDKLETVAATKNRTCVCMCDVAHNRTTKRGSGCDCTQHSMQVKQLCEYLVLLSTLVSSVWSVPYLHHSVSSNA